MSKRPKPTFRALFKPSMEFVVVRPIKRSSDTRMMPGTKIDKSQFRTFHLRSLYQRRLIGEAGSDWAKQMIEAFEADKPLTRPEVSGPVTEADEATDTLEPVKKGKKWTVPGHDETFKTKKAAQEFIDGLTDETEADTEEDTAEDEQVEETQETQVDEAAQDADEDTASDEEEPEEDAWD